MFKSFFYGSMALLQVTMSSVEGIFFSKPNAPAAAATATATATASDKDENMIDKWIPTDNTHHLEILLISGLYYDSNYAPNIKNRICVNKINSIQVQMAAGVTYEYKVDACDPSNEDAQEVYCNEKICDHYIATVQVFTMPWKDTVKILKLDKTIS